MSWAYAEACANLLANQGVIPCDKPVWLLCGHGKGGLTFTEYRTGNRGLSPRKATVCLTKTPRSRLYLPHGEGAF